MKAAVSVLVALICLAAPTAAPEDDASRETVVRITACDSQFSPAEIVVKRGTPVVFELTAVDRDHGFNLPDFDVRADILLGRVTRVRITPAKTGRFNFHCDVYCGAGHDSMIGVLEVKE